MSQACATQWVKSPVRHKNIQLKNKSGERQSSYVVQVPVNERTSDGHAASLLVRSLARQLSPSISKLARRANVHMPVKITHSQSTGPAFYTPFPPNSTQTTFSSHLHTSPHSFSYLIRVLESPEMWCAEGLTPANTAEVCRYHVDSAPYRHVGRSPCP